LNQTIGSHAASRKVHDAIGQDLGFTAVMRNVYGGRPELTE
jgi:hypothetical protein